MGEFVTLEVREGVGTIRLDRPPANAIDRQVGEEMAVAAREAGARDDVGAVVVWGGRKLFAAGADIKGMAGFGRKEITPWVTSLGEACDALDTMPKVTIAAINGFALGGGCEVALACDLRYAATDARLGQPEILIGVIPGGGGTQRLPRLVGEARAKDLILSGRHLDAREAERIGLVSRLVEPDDVLEVATSDARGYARGPAVALATAKDAIRGAGGAMRAGLDAEREAFCALFETRDQKEGMAAFLEKRPPEFDGR